MGILCDSKMRTGLLSMLFPTESYEKIYSWWRWLVTLYIYLVDLNGIVVSFPESSYDKFTEQISDGGGTS